MAAEIVRPNADLNSQWTVSTVGNIDEAVTDPAGGDGAIAQAAIVDDGVEQRYGFAAPSAVDWSHLTVVEVKAYARRVGASGVLTARVNPTGQAADWTAGLSANLGTSYAWHTLGFAAASLPATALAPQVGLIANQVATSIDVDVLYLTLYGILLTGPVGAFSMPEQKTIDALAATEAWRTWMGAATEPEARSRIYSQWAMPSPVGSLVEVMPLAVVNQLSLPQWQRVSGGTQHFLRPSGTVSLAIFDRERWPGDIERSRLAFKNFVGEVCRGLATIAGSGTNLLITAIVPRGDVMRTAPEQDASLGGGYWHAELELQWGD